MFYKSPKDFEEKLTVIINNQRVINLTIQPNCWHIEKLGLFDEISHVRIDNSKTVIFEILFDDDKRNLYKNKSYIKSID
jgi:hypothetical protein